MKDCFSAVWSSAFVSSFFRNKATLFISHMLRAEADPDEPHRNSSKNGKLVEQAHRPRRRHRLGRAEDCGEKVFVNEDLGALDKAGGDDVGTLPVIRAVDEHHELSDADEPKGLRRIVGTPWKTRGHRSAHQDRAP